MTYLLLFYEFFKTGLFSIGGGLATLPFLYNIADNYTWFDREMLIDMIAVAESTPGPIGVNMATFAGFQAAGIPGALTATFALVLPSYIVIVLVMKFLTQFTDNPKVKAAFYGLRPAVVGMIAAAGLSVSKLALLNNITAGAGWLTAINLQAIVFFIIVLALYLKFKLHPLFYIFGAAVAGIVLKL